MRIGIGYDAHRLVENRSLILGGVNIPYKKGLLGHSDADVLIHAIIDSLLGAAKKGDIGKMFPDSDEKYKGISSLMLLEQVGNILYGDGYAVGNIDCVICAQAPVLSPFIKEMEKNIAKCLRVSTGCINVKATTEEGLGFTGSGDGISAQAVCLIQYEKASAKFL